MTWSAIAVCGRKDKGVKAGSLVLLVGVIGGGIGHEGLLVALQRALACFIRTPNFQLLPISNSAQKRYDICTICLDLNLTSGGPNSLFPRASAHDLF